ncbi:MAG: Fpg/Nei family DNA glycosylase [Verrucomicrobia bacterium]|nr:Fpg/Nei family DNA glycosylase [Verrucomicrobiota bacterium]MDA1065209.1 Fpg/Nei family DNA glycosylase [Verrucomicrobiota bacterium]
MPELAEVDYFRKQWSPGIGQKIVRVTLHPWTRLYRDMSPVDLAKSLPGSCLIQSQTHGKQMLFRSDRDAWLGVHLGMTGELSFTEDSAYDDHYAHLVIETENGILLFNDPRQFGRVRFDVSPEAPKWWAALPPEVLSKAFNFSYFVSHLNRRKGTQLKPFLLMQDIFPGVGNWMADEILWRASLAPGRRVKSLSPDESRLIFNEVRWVCKHALTIVGDNWGDFPDSWLFNHRWKDGGMCPKTKQSLKRETIGGRTTCWSPAWQQ